MKSVIKILLSAVVGFVVATFFLNNVKLKFDHFADEIAIGLLLIIFIFFVMGVALYGQIKKLSRADLIGEEEDEADAIIYKKFADGTFFIQCNIILSILVLCILAVSSPNTVLIVLSIVSLLLNYLLIVLFHQLLPSIYPERKLPKFGEANYEEKLLLASDEGERHVMLIGLFKSYGLVNLGLYISIILATLYSVSSGESQMFSIIVMSLVLIAVNGKYTHSIRNK